MHNPESLLEFVTQKFLWDFEIQTDHQNSARRLDLVIAKKKKKKKKKKTCRIVDFAISADHRSK